MLDDLWARLDEADRDRSTIDIAFANIDGGAPIGPTFDADRYGKGLANLTDLGVTWNGIAVPGDSLQHALEALEEYGENVIRAL